MAKKTYMLSEHFSLDEMTRSTVAERMGFSNAPDPVQLERLRKLCTQVLEPLRAHLGRPVRISSGFRSQSVNKAVGGATNSQHMRGQAADIPLTSVREGWEILTWIKHNLSFDQLFLEQGRNSMWVHVSYVAPDKNRNQVLTMQIKK